MHVPFHCFAIKMPIWNCWWIKCIKFRFVLFCCRMISSSELQFFASRHAAAIAAVAAAALPPPPSSATNPNGLSSTASGLNAPPPVPTTHQHDFHPAYRIPGYMEHLYSLQHASAASSSSLHGKWLQSLHINSEQR